MDRDRRRWRLVELLAREFQSAPVDLDDEIPTAPPLEELPVEATEEDEEA